jgi:hypothetical protein
MNKPTHDKVELRGFFHVQIENPDTGEIVGDSGWVQNRITNDGFSQFLVDRMSTSAGINTVIVKFAALGEGTEPGVADNTLESEVTGSGGTKGRKAVTFSNVASKTAQFVATFGSSDSFVTVSENISNIGLFEFSSVGSGDIFAGNDYASSTVATNQNVNITYQIQFATA